MNGNEQGVTLLELLIAIVILGILASLAGPNMSSFVNQGRLKSATESLYSYLLYSRSEAIARNATVRVAIEGSGTNGWCAGVTTGGAYCDCSDNTPACELATVGGSASEASKSLTGSDFTSVTMAAPTAQWVIDGRRGVISTPSTLTLNHPSVGDVQLSINKLGRVRVCSDALQSYPDC